MTHDLIALAFAVLSGGCGGWALRDWRLGRTSAVLNDAIRQGHIRLYARDMPDGRNSRNLPRDRYDKEAA
jgi:hypothetical protein